jgi:hypothetical protein
MASGDADALDEANHELLLGHEGVCDEFFKIKRPFSLKIDIDQKEWPRLIFADQLCSRNRFSRRLRWPECGPKSKREW